MDALKKLADFLSELGGYAGAVVACLASLALIGLLAPVAWAVGQSLVAAGGSAMSASGHALVGCLGVLALGKYLGSKAA